MTEQVHPAYAQGFIDKCAEVGVDPEALLQKQAIIGSMVRGIKEMGQTTDEIAGSRQGMNRDYGKKKFGGRLLAGLLDPIQAKRSRRAYGMGVGKDAPVATQEIATGTTRKIPATT
jgi:hypothetical protein